MIHMAGRGVGCPVRFALTAGQNGDAPRADALIEVLPADFVMADAAYDATRSAARSRPERSGLHPQRPARRIKCPLSKHPYAQRHLIESVPQTEAVPQDRHTL